MLTWLLVNIVLSVLALLFITLNSNAPHRLRFFAGFAALVAWLVPWPIMPELLPANMFSFELWRIERAVEATSTRLTGIFPVIVQTSTAPLARGFVIPGVLELCFIALTLIGCMLFAWKLIAHRLLLRRLQRQGGDGNWLWARAGLAPVCPVAVQREIAGAFSSGLLHPRIWVHGDLVNSPHLNTLLRHEVTHIQQHDNWYLLVITLVERLLWWNPLVWYGGRRTRELQELSCDEQCQRSNADYPAQLAQLMIDSARGTCGTTVARQARTLALSANILNNPNPNIKRIQLLQRSYPMLTRHILGAVVTAATAFLAVGFVTAQPNDVQAVAADRVQLVRRERAPGAEDNVLFAVNVLPPLPGAAQVTSNNVVRRGEVNGERTISLSFSDRPLPGLLMLLVNFFDDGAPGSALAGVAVVRRLDAGGEAVQLSTGELLESLEAAGGAASWGEENRVVSFRPQWVVTDKLVLEYPEAANKIVSITLNDATIDQAIDLIAEASGCNIFQDNDTIVVDYCEE